MNSISEGSTNHAVDRRPDTCPLCQVAIVPTLVTSALIPTDGVWRSAVLEAVFRCPRNECRRLFIARYKFRPPASASFASYGTLFSLQPWQPVPPAVPDSVSKLSPQFADVLAQAAFAEAMGLLELAGIGRRKALEFLVKDYCIHLHPSEVESIKAMFLGRCIGQYVSDANIRACAERAAWLGNDETHYVRLWQDHDLQDLKALLDLTVSWINTALLTEKYLAEMPPKAP